MRRFPRDERGATTIEMTFFVVIFVLLFFGGVELARLVSVKHAMDVGVYRAARAMSLNPLDPDAARQMIDDELQNNVLGGIACPNCMTWEFPNGTHNFQDPVTVTAVVEYTPSIPLMVWVPKTLTVTHTQLIEAYP